MNVFRRILGILRHLMFRPWLRGKLRQSSPDHYLVMPIEVANAEVETVQVIAPSLSAGQSAAVTHRRLQLAAVGLKTPSFLHDADYEPWCEDV